MACEGARTDRETIDQGALPCRWSSRWWSLWRFLCRVVTISCQELSPATWNVAGTTMFVYRRQVIAPVSGFNNFSFRAEYWPGFPHADYPLTLSRWFPGLPESTGHRPA